MFCTETLDSRPTPPGRTRLLFAEGHSIGRGSQRLKQRHLLGRIWRAMAGVTLVVGTATVLGELAGGIGFSGLFTTALAGLLVAALMLRYPRLSIPRQVDLGHGPLATVVARAELWLEGISQGWPPAAVQEVDRLGIQLDALAMELERATLGGKTEHAIRTLVAERLPAAVLRPGPPGAPAETPRLVTALARIGAELSHVTRSLAGGDADGIALVTALAVR